MKELQQNNASLESCDLAKVLALPSPLTPHIKAVTQHSLSMYTPPQASCRFDGQSSARPFIAKFKAIGKSFNWTEKDYVSNIQFHIYGITYSFFEKLFTVKASEQHVPRKQAIVKWFDIKNGLLSSLSGGETYESLEAKLRTIKWDPIACESYFFTVSNILDRMHVTDMKC
jgi:hypothetical protein